MTASLQKSKVCDSSATSNIASVTNAMPANGIPLDKGAVISTPLEAILYGFSVFMFLITLWVLLDGKRHHSINWTMVLVSCFLFAFSTAHMVVGIVRTYEGLVQFRDSYLGGPPAFFSDVAQETFVTKNAIYTLQTLLGDGVVIYRCYVVWQSYWIIVVPVMGWCSVAATAVGSVYSISQATSQATNIFFKGTGRWITAFFASTFSTNLLSTCLLAYRIWSVNKVTSSSHLSTRTLLPVLLIVIDSGVLYSVTLIVALICFIRQSNGQFVVLDMVCPIISIAFYMIIIRVGMQRRNASSQRTTTNTTFNASSRALGSDQYHLKPLQVHITQLSETQTDNRPESISKPGREAEP